MTVKVEAASSTVESIETKEAKPNWKREKKLKLKLNQLEQHPTVAFTFFLRILQLVEQGNELSDCTESEYRAMFSEEVRE
ncbi:unnamed protein product, partial [Ilex paraguariensis]